MLLLASTGLIQRTSRDIDPTRRSRRLGPLQVDGQEPVVEVGAHDLHSVSQHESALELSRGDAAMQELPPGLLLGLLAANDEFVVFDRDVELLG